MGGDCTGRAARVYNFGMIVQLHLSKELALRLLAEVQKGRHRSVEEAILERLSRADDPDLLAVTGLDSDRLRRDLDDAWSNRKDAVDGESAFTQIAAKSASFKAQDK